MYSPGKAFVVYEIRRHVWEVVNGRARRGGAGEAYLADGTVTGDDALWELSACVSLHLAASAAYLQGLRRGCSSHCGGVGVRISNEMEAWMRMRLQTDRKLLDAAKGPR